MQALLRTDFLAFLQKCFVTLEPGVPYQHNWHLEAIAESLRQITDGETRRLIVNVPPRSGKSIVISIAYTAWVLGHDPTRRIICVSYSEALAKAHHAAFRTLVTSPWYRALFPAFAIQRGGDRETETVTTARGYRFAVSLSGSVLGRGADLIIGDDPMSPEAALSEAVRLRQTQLWMSAHRTRLNNKRTGAIVLVMQRLHEADLVGHVMQEEAWEHLVIPATAEARTSYKVSRQPGDLYVREAGEVLLPEREPAAILAETRRALGSRYYAAQYQQDPVPPDGNLIERGWLRSFADEAALGEFDYVIASWDTASTIAETSDYSVGQLWGVIGEDFYLLHVERLKVAAPTLRAEILKMHEDEYLRVHRTLIENTGHGRAIADELWASGRLRPEMRTASRDKRARLEAVAHLFEAGRVHLPQDAAWREAYERELLSFPVGRHDDQVDATSQALLYLEWRLRGARAQERRNLTRREVRPRIISRTSNPG
ncbi:phage terminase large subunit [Methylobacterium sp. A54F]